MIRIRPALNARRASNEAASQRTFFGAVALAFGGAWASTIAWCGSMPVMHDMKLPGDSTMSMPWMRMPGQTWPGVAVAFLGMWLVMMIAMMLPALAPVLWRYRRAAATVHAARATRASLLVGLAYFVAWTGFGALVFVAGALLAALEMRVPAQARAMPVAAGAAVLLGGALQFTPWKARRLACCRDAFRCCAALPADAAPALRAGLRLGIDCIRCCFGLTLSLCAVGIMDLRAMALLTVATGVERLAPNGVRAARGAGLCLVATALFLLARAAES